MNPEEFAKEIEDAGMKLASRVAFGFTTGETPIGEQELIIGLCAEMVARCRELAQEARTTGARSWDQLRDRRAVLTPLKAVVPSLN